MENETIQLEETPQKRKLISPLLIAAIIFVLLIAGAVVFKLQRDKIKNMQAHATSTVDFSFGNKKGKAYLVPASTPNVTKLPAGACISGDVSIANYKLYVTRPLIGQQFSKIYSYDLPELSFVKGTPFSGNLIVQKLNLSDRVADEVVVSQYQDCAHSNARVMAINPKNDRLEPIQFKSVNQTNPYVVMVNGSHILNPSKDKIDTFVRTSVSGFEKIHWQFDPKANIFNETGKESATKAE